MTAETQMLLVALRRTWLNAAAACVTGLDVKDIPRCVEEIEAAFEKAGKGNGNEQT